MTGTKLSKRSLRESVDWWIVILYLVLVLTGICSIYASVHSEQLGFFDWASRSGKQVVWAAISLSLGALVLFAIPPRIYEQIAFPSYVLVFVLLVAVIFLSNDIKGSHSWFSFGPLSFQPAEISKTTTSLLLSAIIGRYDFAIDKPRNFLRVLAVIVFPMLAILAEDETGSMLVYLGFAFMLYREGMTGWLLAFAFLVVVCFITTLIFSPLVAIVISIALITLVEFILRGDLKGWFKLCFPTLVFLCVWPFLYPKLPLDSPVVNYLKPSYFYILFTCVICIWSLVMAYRKMSHSRLASAAAILAAVVFSFSVQFIFENVLQDHQRSRIEVLLGMKEDLKGAGYNVHQSMIAIGSGGFFGKGWLQGTQTRFGFVPEQSTDFIFCTIGEEAGFLGASAVIILYVLLIWRILRAAESSREAFTRIYGYCISGCIFMHLFINVGMTVGLMPVIGIPLPLISYGGSSLVSFTLMIAIFLALSRNEKKYF